MTVIKTDKTINLMSYIIIWQAINSDIRLYDIKSDIRLYDINDVRFYDTNRDVRIM